MARDLPPGTGRRVLRYTKPSAEPAYSSWLVFAIDASRLPCSTKDTFPDTYALGFSAPEEPDNRMGLSLEGRYAWRASCRRWRDRRR